MAIKNAQTPSYFVIKAYSCFFLSFPAFSFSFFFKEKKPTPVSHNLHPTNCLPSSSSAWASLEWPLLLIAPHRLHAGLCCTPKDLLCAFATHASIVPKSSHDYKGPAQSCRRFSFVPLGLPSFSQQKALHTYPRCDQWDGQIVLSNVAGCEASFIYFDDHLGYV